ncbi:hypothetical protein Tco_0122312 [Tanacetum coccineum]
MTKHRRSDPIDEIVTDAVDWAMQAPLRARFRDLPTIDIKEILQQWMFKDNSYKAHEVYNDLYEALQKSLEQDYSNQHLADQEEARKKKRKKRAAPRTPFRSPPSRLPPLPPPAGSAQQASSEASRLSKPTASTYQSMAWTTSDTRFESTNFITAQELSPIDSLMQDDSIPDEQTNPEGDQVRVNVNQPLPLDGPLGHVTIQLQFFFNKDLEYLRYGSKGSNPTLSISKMKAASYHDFGLELLVLKQMWIDDVCTYEISARCGIFHWWFNRQKFYIDRHDSLSRQKDVRTHMRILSVVKIKAYSRYEYDYLSKIILRRADFQEHTIAEKYFKNLYPSDCEDLNLLLLQGHLDHIPGLDKRMLSTALNLTKPGWDATSYEFKHDYTIIESPRAVVFPIDNNDRKIMRFNEIYKFSDGTLTRILEALDYRVKEFKVLPEHPSDTKVLTMKMEILLEPTSNKLLVADIYIDTRPNGDALRKCILKGPYKLTTVTIPAVHVTDDTPTVPERTSVETLLTMSHENKAHYESKKEAIHLLLSRIEDEIYSTVDACKTFRKFTSHDGDSMESHYSRFYKMMNEMIINNLTVGTMQVNVQILQQLQPEWSSYQRKFNEICDKNTNNATPLTLVADASPYPGHYYQAPKSHKPYAPTSKQSSSTRSNASNKFKGKEIAKPITPPSESASKEDSDLEQAKRDKDMKKNLSLIAKYFKKIYKPTNNNLRTFSNTRNKNVDTSP